MKKNSEGEKAKSLEETLAELERIVQELEKGQLPLDASLEKFETGVGLYQACRKSLVAAEKKIKILSDGLKEETWEE